MSGADPNEKDNLSQESTEAEAIGEAAAGDQSPGAADAVNQPSEPVEPAAAESGESGGGFVGLTQEEVDAALAGETLAPEAPPASVARGEKLDSAGRPFDAAAAMMEAAIAEERAAAAKQAAAAGQSASTPAAAPTSEPAAMPAGAVRMELPDFDRRSGSAAEHGIDLLHDVELNVKIELGRAEMLIEDVLKLGEGSVVELDKLAGDPVDVFVNDRLVARGEVIVLNDNFCVRVSEIVAGVGEEQAA